MENKILWGFEFIEYSVVFMFQRDDGLLVWQKRGFRDNAMFQFTMGLMVFGFIPLTALIYSMAFPEKKD